MEPEHLSTGMLRESVEPGPFASRILGPASRITGFASIDDLHQFWILLRTQAAAGFRGDVLEIGCFHGQAAYVLARALEPGESLHLNGVIALDDFEHPSWPEITPAARAFLEERDDIAVLADVNRHNATGRKLYLARR